MCACHGFMSAELDGVQCKSYLLFETATPLGWVKVKAPYGLDASKLKKSDGTENFQNMRDSYYDSVVNGVTTGVIQKMQNAEGVQLGLLSILTERGKACLRLPDGNELKKLCNCCNNHTEKEDPNDTCCMFGYRVGLTGAVLEYAVKNYKSHRRLFS